MFVHELDNIHSILVQNGYPEFLKDSKISKNFYVCNKEGSKMSCLFKIILNWQKFPEI